MASENNFQSKVESLFKGMDGYMHSKTVVGDAITVGDTIILPLIDVSFGVAAGALEGQENSRRKNNGGGGMGCKMTPSAVLVIQNGTSKLVNVKNQDGLTKVLDMVPDFVNRFTSGTGFASGAASGTSASDQTAGEESQVNGQK
ncbi:MAG: GerW family sporulation protein [Eubacteriales bacterium]|nr:GerW family sporulation protein [Eubacteriales bacterium]